MFLYVGGYLLIYEFVSWITGALLLLFLCVLLHTMWSGKSLQVLCILPFGMMCLSAISMMFVNKVCWQCVCWWVWWSERKRELYTVRFLVVGESPSVLL